MIWLVLVAGNTFGQWLSAWHAGITQLFLVALALLKFYGFANVCNLFLFKVLISFTQYCESSPKTCRRNPIEETPFKQKPDMQPSQEGSLTKGEIELFEEK